MIIEYSAGEVYEETTKCDELSRSIDARGIIMQFRLRLERKRSPLVENQICIFVSAMLRYCDSSVFRHAI